MAWTQIELSALERSISEGAKVVQYADRRVEYHTLKEMLNLRSLMRQELGLAESPTKSGIGARRYASHSKGLK